MINAYVGIMEDLIDFFFTFYRIIMTPTRGLDASLQLACALAGTENHSEYNYVSGERFDIGNVDTWYMKDEDGDGRDDYCR